MKVKFGLSRTLKLHQWVVIVLLVSRSIMYQVRKYQVMSKVAIIYFKINFRQVIMWFDSNYRLRGDISNLTLTETVLSQ